MQPKQFTRSGKSKDSSKPDLKTPRDTIQQAKEAQEKKTVEAINKQKFDREWTLKSRGPSLANYQLTIIMESLFKCISQSKDLVAASRELSQMLKYELGSEYWNVIIVIGSYARKTFASGGYFVVFQRFDGMEAIIWLNKLRREDTMEKSIINDSEYF